MHCAAAAGGLFRVHGIRSRVPHGPSHLLTVRLSLANIISKTNAKHIVFMKSNWQGMLSRNMIGNSLILAVKQAHHKRASSSYFLGDERVKNG
jgi:hypothetical protein